MEEVKPPKILLVNNGAERPKTLSTGRRPTWKTFRRTLSHGHINAHAATSTEFVFQQPAYDPDLLKHDHLPVTARGSNRRGWNSQNAVYVKRMGQRAAGYKYMHGQSSRYFSRRYQWIGILAILFNAAATTGNIPYVATCQDNLNWIKIIAIIIGFFVTLTMAFHQFKNYGSLTSEHANSEANYAALYDHIRQQLQKNSRDRQDANDYSEWISKQLIDLKAASPLIPPSIWARYRKLIKGSNIADPEGIDEIIIKRDSPDRPDLEEVVVDTHTSHANATSHTAHTNATSHTSHTKPKHAQTEIPKSGRLGTTNVLPTTSSSLPKMTERDRIAFERWNENENE